MSDYSKEIVSIIKQRTRLNGLTQQDLATNLRVSLPTIKRWLAGEFVTIDNLKRLCEEVGLTLSEVFAMVESYSVPKFQYTLEQEGFFAEHPDYLAFFDNLLRGYTVNRIQKKFSLSQRKVELYLAKLDKLELIDWLPQNKSKLLISGEPVWRKDGALAKKLRKEIFNSFQARDDQSNSYFFLHDYLPEDAAAIQSRIEELIQFASRADKRSKARPEDARPKGLYISCQDFRWSLDEYLKSVT